MICQNVSILEHGFQVQSCHFKIVIQSLRLILVYTPTRNDSQTVAMLVSVGATMYALKTGFGTLATTSQSLLAQPWFLVLVVAGAIERLTGLAIGVAAERDWVVLVSVSSLT